MRNCVALAFVLAASSSLLVGCVDDNEAVVVIDPSVDAPEAAISGSVLGVTVSGAFKLSLALGPRASGPSTVQIGAFALTDAKNETSIVPSLSLISSTALPVKVELDSVVTVDFLFDIGDKTVPTETKDALCLPEGVRVAGTIQDSLERGAIPVASAPFAPTGCM